MQQIPKYKLTRDNLSPVPPRLEKNINNVKMEMKKHPVEIKTPPLLVIWVAPDI